MARWLIPAHAGKTSGRRRTTQARRAHPRSRGENIGCLVGAIIVMGSSPLTRGKRPSPARRTSDAGLIPAHAGKTPRRSAVSRGRAAHPRSRGENSLLTVAGVHAGGSSPLTRGKRHRREAALPRARLIPAHAGKTGCRGFELQAVEAHPRSRGENNGLGSRERPGLGSSPLTRGKPRTERTQSNARGLIPAHAGKTPQTPTERTPRPAHPRSRGENSRVSPCREFLTGSSPLTRGKPVSRRVMTSPRGLIPAHAGKTRNSLRRALRSEAHPRSRGENTQAPPPAHARLGSSPLTRGKHARPRVRVFDLGLIPAHAGKTAAPLARRRYTRAHPRSRGENCQRQDGKHQGRGSSPLTRGKQLGVWRGHVAGGLIPAHAGKTSTPMSTWRSGRAHPRSRGENWAASRRWRSPSGSSPLTRGKRRELGRCHRRHGLIPAHAGKTLLRGVILPSPGAHPRSRGENWTQSSGKLTGKGSSPLTRGKQTQRDGHSTRQRLIPAHAGKTSAVTSSPCLPWAHPRSRGENEQGTGNREGHPGSSPLTRGKLGHCGSLAWTIGLIPAHAGKTSSPTLTRSRVTAHPRSRGENGGALDGVPGARGSSPLTRGKLSHSTHRVINLGLIPAHAGKTDRHVEPPATTRAHPRSRGENNRRARTWCSW